MPRMHMTFQDGLFAVRTYNREDGSAAKEAGARWHGPHNYQYPADRCEACTVGLPLMDWWYFAKKDQARAVRLKEIADEYALEALESATARLEVSRSTGTAKAASQALLDAPVPAPRGLEYKPYQKAGIAFMLSAPGGALLADDPGLGKTIQILGLLNADPSPTRALIVVPASLRLNWVREAVRWLVRPTQIFVIGEKGLTANIKLGGTQHRVSSGPVLPSDVCSMPNVIVIVNYDRARTPALHEQLMSCNWDLLAADEAHFLKNPKSQRTIAVLGQEKKGVLVEPGLRQRSARFIAMTGTPLPNRPIEMWPILHAVAPATFPEFFPFARRYCDANQKFISARVGSKWDFTGASHLGELQDVMRSTCMVRRLKGDVLKELPPKVRTIIALPWDEYSDVVEVDDEDVIDDDEELRDEVLVDLLDKPDLTSDAAYRLAAELLGKSKKISFTDMSRERERLAIRKVPAVLELCDDKLAEEKKIIIFAHHHSVIKKLLDHYNKKGKPPIAVALYGPVSAAQRDQAVELFQNDESIRVFIGSIAAAGVGLTLTAASTVIFAEVSFVPGEVVQAEDRAHRIGQHDVVNVLHVVVERSIDARMVQMLVAKADIADRALDRGNDIFVPEAGPDMAALKKAKRAAEDAKHPPVSPRLRELVSEAMMSLDEHDLDRATERNNQGFNKMHSGIGHSIAIANPDDLTAAQVWYGAHLANFYRRQLGALAVEVASEAARIKARAA